MERLRDTAAASSQVRDDAAHLRRLRDRVAIARLCEMAAVTAQIPDRFGHQPVRRGPRNVAPDRAAWRRAHGRSVAREARFACDGGRPRAAGPVPRSRSDAAVEAALALATPERTGRAATDRSVASRVAIAVGSLSAAEHRHRTLEAGVREAVPADPTVRIVTAEDPYVADAANPVAGRRSSTPLPPVSGWGLQRGDDRRMPTELLASGGFGPRAKWTDAPSREAARRPAGRWWAR